MGSSSTNIQSSDMGSSGLGGSSQSNMGEMSGIGGMSGSSPNQLQKDIPKMSNIGDQ